MRITELDSLRFLAILIVVINHLGAKGELFSWHVISHATSPVMACISSYLLFRNLDNPKQLVQKLKHRLTSLILPYFLWTLISFAFFQSVKSMIAISNLATVSVNRPAAWSIEEYWINFVVHPNPGAFWFLQNLILILPFVFIIYHMIKPKWSIVLVLAATIILYNYNLVPYFSIRFLPYYFFGAWLGIHYATDIPVIVGNRYVILSLAILILICNECVAFELNIIVLIANLFFQLSIFFLGINLIRHFSETWVIKYFQGKLYMSFYLHASHMLVLLIIGSVLSLCLKSFPVDREILQLVLPLFMFGATFKIVELVASLMKLKIPRVYNALSGLTRI